MATKQQVKGFTLIELIMVIVILGVLSAFALPRFVNFGDDALAASKAGMTGAVRSTHGILVAQLRVSGDNTFPTVTALAAGVDGDGITAVATGVQVTINGTTYVAPTFTDAACTAATAAVADAVQCVGQIP